MLAKYLRRLLRTALRGIFGSASDWAWFIGPPLIYLAARTGALKLNMTDGLIGSWLVGIVSFGIALVGLTLWRFVSASFRVFVEDQTEIDRLGAGHDPLLLRQIEVLEEQNRLSAWANDPFRLMLNRNRERLTNMMDRHRPNAD